MNLDNFPFTGKVIKSYKYPIYNGYYIDGLMRKDLISDLEFEKVIKLHLFW